VHGAVEADGLLIEGYVLVGSEPPEADVSMTVTIDEPDPGRSDGPPRRVGLLGVPTRSLPQMAPDDERLAGAAVGGCTRRRPRRGADGCGRRADRVEHVGARDEGPGRALRLTVDHTARTCPRAVWGRRRRVVYTSSRTLGPAAQVHLARHGGTREHDFTAGATPSRSRATGGPGPGRLPSPGRGPTALSARHRGLLDEAGTVRRRLCNVREPVRGRAQLAVSPHLRQ